jgi:hypothetical protein
MMLHMKGAALICSLVLLDMAFAQQKPRDVYGWGKIRWGMTVAQAKEVYGAGVRVSHDKGENEENEKLVIDNFKIGDVSMKVSIQTETPNSDQIKSVKMTMPAENFLDKAETRSWPYVSLLNALTLKYGKPARTERETDEPVVSDSATWIFPSTTISLQRIESNGAARFGLVNLVYWATDKKAVNAL